MGGMSGALENAGTAIEGKVKQGAAFGVGNIIDSTGIGALTGTGFNSAATGLSALEKVHQSGGVLNAIGDTLKEGFTADAGAASGASDASIPDGGSEMFSAKGFENLTPDAGSEMFSMNQSPADEGFSWGQHKEDFFDGLTKNGSSFVMDENGKWDASRSLAKGAGKYAQNKIGKIGSKNHVDKDFAQEEMKRMMAQTMMQG